MFKFNRKKRRILLTFVEKIDEAPKQLFFLGEKSCQ